ncbi:MAG: hypothetical protein M0Q53_20500 [Prolixibacteraceae bacterium]|nr:hypothetical protein [Prolixibacteraceae bacterium]
MHSIYLHYGFGFALMVRPQTDRTSGAPRSIAGAVSTNWSHHRCPVAGFWF